MQFTKFAAAAVLALASTVCSQVVVTITNTVTVITVTVTPLSTSTSTVIVTVTGTPTTTTPKGPSTITSTVTVVKTSTPAPSNSPVPTTCPIPLYYKCGGNDWEGNCTKCEKTATCVSQNAYYSQCQAKTPPVVTVTSTIYGGRQ